MTAAPDPTDLFAGDGEMRAAFRRHDWSATPLGAEATWSPALHSSVLHILWSAFPNLVLWGPELVQLYNEAYRDLLGDERLAGLGRSTREVAPHDWEINAPIYARVLAGETLSREGAPFSVTRSGKAETLHLTLSYTPIHDEGARVAGVLVTVFETEGELSAPGGGPAPRGDATSRGRVSDRSAAKTHRPPAPLSR